MAPRFNRSFRAIALALPLMALSAGAALAAQLELVMAEQRGCIWCERWDAEVAPEYPITDEGRAAPLRRVNIHEELPGDVTFAAPLRITPTFVIVRDGVEVTRLEGYPGEHFFWGLLQRMIDEARGGPDGDG